MTVHALSYLPLPSDFFSGSSGGSSLSGGLLCLSALEYSAAVVSLVQPSENSSSLTISEHTFS